MIEPWDRKRPHLLRLQGTGEIVGVVFPDPGEPDADAPLADVVQLHPEPAPDHPKET